MIKTLISIITINLNNKNGLLRTLKSLEIQDYKEFELIIVDGESVDGSQEVIAKFLEVSSANIKFICEKDLGIYDAMNKGLSLATAEFILFLNSGDCLDSAKVLDSVASVEGEFDVIYGNLKVCNSGQLREIKSNPTICFFKQYQHDLPPQPAVFFRRTLIQNYGGFDLSYKIISDVVLIANIFANPDTTYFYLDIVITNFDLGGISSARENQRAIICERERFISEKYPQYLSSLKAYYKSDRSLLGRIISKIKSL
jgi:glycosyltransferase involved in cell wall biosynthesis